MGAGLRVAPPGIAPVAVGTAATGEGPVIRSGAKSPGAPCALIGKAISTGWTPPAPPPSSSRPTSSAAWVRRRHHAIRRKRLSTTWCRSPVAAATSDGIWHLCVVPATAGRRHGKPRSPGMVANAVVASKWISARRHQPVCRRGLLSWGRGGSKTGGRKPADTVPRSKKPGASVPDFKNGYHRLDTTWLPVCRKQK